MSVIVNRLIKNQFTLIVFLLALSVYFTNIVHAESTSNWSLNKGDMYFESGTPKNNYFALLLEKLQSDKGIGREVTYEELDQLLNRINGDSAYLDAILKYAKPKSIKKQNKAHKSYSNVFMKPRRIKAGVTFYHEYKDLLDAAEVKYEL
jgi:membrane-bound lytic murein transglycosylase B